MFNSQDFVSPFAKEANGAVRAVERETKKADFSGAVLRACVAVALAESERDGRSVATEVGRWLIYAEGSKAKATGNAYRSAVSWLFGGAKEDVQAGKERLAAMRAGVGDVTQMSAADFAAAVAKAAEPFASYWADYKKAGADRKAADAKADADAAAAKAEREANEAPTDPLLTAVQDALRAIRVLQQAGEPAAQYVADLRAFLEVTEHAKAA